jgi:hypothetical protein
MRYSLLVLTLLVIASGSNAQDPGKPAQSNGSLVRSESEFNLLINEQQRKLQQALNEVEWEPKREPASQMTKEQQKLEVEWSKWMLDIRKQLKAQATTLSTLQKKKMSYEQKLEEMKEVNMQFLALYEAMDMESRKFQTLSNASRARHEAAMNAIRNLK